MALLRTRLAVLGSAVAFAAGVFLPAQSAGAAPSAAQRLEWVALGDSYTAGAIKAAGDTFEVPRDGCERTDQAYPQIIDSDLGSLVGLTNVSCGNATIENVHVREQEPIGHHLPPFSTDPDYPFPPVPPQIDAVAPDTDLVTVGVGGNTLGFGEIIFNCLQVGQGSGGVGTPCRDELADSIPERLEKVSSEYGDMLDAIHRRAPFARVLTVGYPTIVPQDTGKCRYNDWEQFASITRDDLDWLRTDVLEPLNAVIEQATHQYGDAFVDLYRSSHNHSVCDAGKWVEGIFTSFPNEPALVHPNAQGHQNAARHVEDAILGA